MSYVASDAMAMKERASTNARAKLVEGIFLRYIDARIAFCFALQRCAIKGWPDRRALVTQSTRAQELFFAQLSARLNHLVRHAGSDDTQWNKYRTTNEVHERLWEYWSEQEKEALKLRDPAYGELQRAISELQAISDPDALTEPFKMAKRDPELIAAGWELNNIALALDRELAE
jgi:hypothetical protein